MYSFVHRYSSNGEFYNKDSILLKLHSYSEDFALYLNGIADNLSTDENIIIRQFIARQFVEGLYQTNEIYNIAQLDLKPENILFSTKTESPAGDYWPCKS